MSSIFEVRAESVSDSKMYPFGAFRTRPEAEMRLAETKSRFDTDEKRHLHKRFWIEEIATTGLFELPPRPSPRERYVTRVEQVNAPNQWHVVNVEIMDRDRVVGTYERGYRMLQTFEPFRQGNRDFALISPEYTGTSVMDLSTGEIIAAEPASGEGFCPVGFYVPDWWDVHDGTVLPGSTHWRPDKEWPSAGDFGFVWGCIWGDDSSWKVQYLDLSNITSGVLRREERFGYLRLATNPAIKPQELIRLQSYQGVKRVDFAIRHKYDLTTGDDAEEDPWA